MRSREPGRHVPSLPSWAFAALVLVAAPASGAPEPILLDGVVAAVAGKFQGTVPPQVITLWDLESECRIESIQRYGADGVDRPISKSLRATILEQIVDDTVILREAERLGSGDVEEEKIDEELERAAQAAGGMDRFTALLGEASIPIEKVRSILERRLVADRYVLDSLRLSMSYTEKDLRDAFETMSHPFKDRSLEEVHEEFVEYLLGEEAAAHRAELVSTLSERCHIWLFIDIVSSVDEDEEEEE